ncbi:hypothetical protein [Novosphingobium sp.]|uniref:hypothetical protein n=1 Tax=Novosphingobium sp. TaxID=1874826 RepID=UPI003D11361A
MDATEKIKRCEENVIWWEKQAAQIERDRDLLKWVMVVGAIAAIAAGLWKWQAGVGILGVAAMTWTMGMYMTFVRRDEFAHNLREAHAELVSVRQDSSGA